ncbi:nicotinate-nucleotide adenylyltransferase [Pseudalkalibacillus berkeleyi]|uniref:Probable nicotinate-nucleotide adenylyltransferase n=1 Tax=Pseudalkalibacillus berkeleyi TaxID=1069813 RepID=A0ABS9GZ06_9BACL|nr:nicotinate-nucleotide adenylyltransferase [Pseudalkalibacillus berkeleyi]MCF6137997.1 nicotinate-nucleotide adenylyltransferase [Pseudalkalibacillus berkeleyi]
MTTRKIGILGGTFDPPHLGHLIIASEAKEQCDLDQVWFMPSATPPHKSRQVSSGKHRVAMVEEMIVDREDFEVSTIEFDRPGPSFTVDTILQLKDEHPNVQFYFIIGGDMVDSLHTWERIETLLNLVTFVGVKRPGYKFQTPFIQQIQSIDTPLIDLSSTMLRERFKSGKNTQYYVTKRVGKYIEVNRLYEDGTSIEDC